jgi:hypothetical protein
MNWRKPYLIQRLTKVIQPHPGLLTELRQFSLSSLGKKDGRITIHTKTLLDKICLFDAMESIDMHWDLVSMALAQLISIKNTYCSFTVTLVNKLDVKDELFPGSIDVHIICNTPHVAEVLAFLNKLNNNEYIDLKEDAKYLDAIYHRNDVVGWFDIENLFFFTIDINVFERLKLLFGIS